MARWMIKSTGSKLGWALLLAGLLLGAQWCLAGAPPRPVGTKTLALVGGAVIPSPEAEPIPDAVVLVKGEKIIAVGPRNRLRIPSSAEHIDCSGKIITAGFWNSHVHFTEDAWKDAAHAPRSALEEHMQAMLTRWGFTTVFDLASFLKNTDALRARVEAGEVPGPTIYTVGEPLYPEHGIPVYLGPEWNIPQATSPQVARAMAEQRLADGADGIKVFAGAIVKGEVLPMDPQIIRAAVQAAHAARKPVFAHPSNHAGTDNALGGGVDVLAHTIPMESTFTDDELRRMKAQHVALSPTLSLFPDEEKKFGGTEESAKAVLATAEAQLKSYFSAGGTILFGTDVGYTQVYDTTSEFTSMAAAGMTWRDILASLTVNPATFFYHPERGRVEKGMRADLVILDSDPAADVRSFARVAYTIRAGTVICRKL